MITMIQQKQDQLFEQLATCTTTVKINHSLN